MALELHHHEFHRSRDTTFCFVCQNVWPANDVVLSKYQTCSICGLGVHTGCRPVAKQCYPCNTAISHATLSSGEWRNNQTSGIVQAQLLHSYDMLVAPDTPIYAIMKLSSCKDTFQTEKSIVQGSDCLWKPDAKPVHLRYVLQDMDSHVVIGPPLLEVDIYKTVYGIFETNVANCKISLLPLFLYPDICIERWFTFHAVSDGSVWGKVLMRLQFIPQNKHVSWIEKLLTVAAESASKSVAAEIVQPAAGAAGASTDYPTPSTKEEEQVDEAVQVSQQPSELQPLNEYIQEHVAEPIVGASIVSDDLLVEPAEESCNGCSSAIVSENDPLSPIPPSAKEESVSDMEESKEEFAAIVENSVAPQSDATTVEEIHAYQVASAHTAPPSTPPMQQRRRRVPRSKEFSAKPISRLLPGAVKDTRHQDSHEHPAMPPLPIATPATIANSKRVESDSDKLDAGNVYSAASFGLLSPSTVNWMSNAFSQLVTEAKNYSALAVDSVTNPSTRRKRKRVNVQDGVSEVSSATEDNGVGSLYIHVDSALMTIAKDAADGNYYIIVSVDGKADAPVQEEDTDIVYSSASPVFNQNFEFTVYHYRSIVKLTVVDATNENKVGDATISLHAIIQRDAEKYGSDWSKAETEEFVLRDSSERSVGIIRSCIKFKEDINDLMYSLTPRPAPDMPKEDMSFDRIKVHIARAKAIIDSINALGREYRRIMDWENPVYTLAALVCFVYTVTAIDAEYALCVPLFFFVVLLTIAWIRRKSGSLRKRFVEVKDDQEAVQYRPVGYIRVAVAGFRNFVHRFGFSGPPPFVRVSYHCKSDVVQERQIALINLSKSGRHGHRSNNLASLMSSLSMKKSNDAKDALLQNVSDPWPRPGTVVTDVDKADMDISYLYPILQPLKSDGKNKASKQTLVPWNENDGVIKFTLYGDNPMSSFVDSAWGSVSIRVKELFSDASRSMQPEIDGWYEVDWSSAFLNKSRNEHLISQSSHNGASFPSMLNKDHDAEPRVFLRLQLDLRNAAKEPTFDDIEISKVVQSLVDPKDERGETTISAIWNARDHIKFVQNILATIVGTIESFCNIFNWTVPSKTFPIYVILVATWFASVIIPARYLILSAGLFEFFYKFMPQPEDAPMVIRFENLLKSIPNEDDLEQIYYWERKAHSEKILAEQRVRLKKAKLRIVLDCQWDGNVHLRGTSRSGQATWNPVFLVLQGKRLVWWSKEEDIDEGRAHAGELLLQGHAGITQTSPVDIKEIGDSNRLTSIFGRDSVGHQHKITILFSDTNDCDSMKTEIQRMLT